MYKGPGSSHYHMGASFKGEVSQVVKQYSGDSTLCLSPLVWKKEQKSAESGRIAQALAAK